MVCWSLNAVPAFTPSRTETQQPTPAKDLAVGIGGLLMGKINSRAKGARGERELARKLTEHGYPAIRGQQHSGNPDNPDVICESLIELLAIECKWVENLNVRKALEQSRRDANDTQIPCVMHKKNGTEWLVTMPLDDFMAILQSHPDHCPELKGEPKCSECGSKFVMSSKVMLLQIPDTLPTNYKCNDCGHSWESR